MGYISAQQTRYSHMISGFLLFAILLVSAGNATAGTVITVCNDCHGMPPKDGATRKGNPHFRSYSSATVGNHLTHLPTSPVANNCVVCHGSVAESAFGHQDGHIDFQTNINTSPAIGQYKVSGTAITFKNQTSIPVLGTCSNVNCHFESTTLTWGSTPFTPTNNCDKCHSDTTISSARHTIHTAKYACTQCHSDHAAEAAPFAHATSAGQRAIKVIFTAAPNNGTGSYSDTSIDYLPSQAHTYGTCNTLYCHSSGNINNAGTAVAPTTYTNPNWNSTAVGGCSVCHGDGLAGGKAHPVYGTGAVASATANSHVKHVESSLLSCDFCHNSTTTSATIPPTSVLASGAHLNRADDVSFKANGGKTGTYAAAGKTCSTTYCHGTGPSVGWGGATTCVSCHDATSSLMLRHDKHYNSTTAPTVLAGGANAHTTSAYVYSCLACHPSNQHSTGPADAVAPLQDAAVAGTKITAYTKGTAAAVDTKGYNYTTNGTCSTVCHTKDGVTAASAVVAQNWGTAATGTCGVCHSKAGDASPTWSVAHTKHINTYNVTGLNTNITCSSCHSGTAVGNTALQATIQARTQHPNANRDLAMDTFATGGVVAIAGAQGAQNCANTYCHSNGTIAAGTHTALSWTAAAFSTCAECHGNAASLVTGSHNNHLAAVGVTCNSCHNATASNNTTVTSYSNHVNKNVTINFNAAAASNAGATYNSNIAGGSTVYQKAIGGAVGSCATTVCHGTSSPSWGSNSTSVTCTKCHGKSTVLANYSSTSGRQAAPGYAQSAGTPYTNGVSATAAYGAHDAHIRAVNQYTTRETSCSDCHGTLPTTSTHANGTTNFTWSNLARNVGTTFAARATLTPGYATGTCSAVYCHGDGGVFLGTQGTDTTPAWTDQAYLTAYAKNVTNCGKCHAALPVVPAKDHSAIAYTAGTCNSCHGHDGNGANHIDGTLQAAGDCNSCHDYDSVGSVWTGAPTNRYTTTGTWGTNAISAGNAGFGAHARHINYIKARLSISTALVATNQTFGVGDNKFVCGTCHTVLEVNHNSASNPNRSINFNDGGNMLAPSHTTQQSSLLYLTGTNPSYNYDTTAGTGARTCSNLSCHYFTSPAWSN